jgi:hypothetical protein
LTNIISDALDKHHKCIVIFLDLKKPFDSVSHVRLLNKLMYCGVSGTIRKWFKSYLKDRNQRVKIDQSLSDPLSGEFGIPQGTVLGPILFILYLNDIFNLRLEGKILSYADDTVVLCSAPTWDEVTDKATNSVTNLKEWFDVNLLSLNTDKTVFIPFTLTNRSPIPDIKVLAFKDSTRESFAEISKTNETKYLGVIIDRNLNFKSQIKATVSRLRKTIYIFNNLKNILKPSLLKIVYYAFVHSVLVYGVTGWGGTYKTNLLPVEVIQRMIIKIIIGKPRDHPTELIFGEFAVPAFHQIVKESAILFSYRHHYFQIFSTSNDGRTRAQHKIKIPRNQTSTAQKRCFYRGIMLFNGLPDDIRGVRDLVVFKKKLKMHMRPQSDN